MVNICSNCGVKVNSDEKFCFNCGKAVQDEIHNSTPTQKPVSQQSYSQIEEFSPIQPKKPNKKLIVVLITIISLIVICAIILIVLLGGSSSNNQFVGTWNISTGTGINSTVGSTITFQPNGDLKAGSMGFEFKIGTWGVEGNKLCINSQFFTQYATGKICMIYSFSYSGKTLTLQDPLNIILTKQ